VGVISGELQYPDMEDLRKWLDKYTEKTWFVDATEQALALGNPILGNVMLVGALAGAAEIPLDKDAFGEVIAESMPKDKVEINVTAFEMGAKAIQ
jgi:indolepyruvate ferredoxin oxidoreductase beta subunit